MRAIRLIGVTGLLLLLGTTDLHAQDLPARAVRAENRPLQSLRAAAENARRTPPPFTGMVRTIPNKVFAPDSRAVDQAGVTEGPVQTALTGAPATATTSFDGSDNWDNAAVVGSRVAPPDTDVDVGPNHVVQTINLVTTIFDKVGNVIWGPEPTSVFWEGMTGSPAADVCRDKNRGDPVVLYDEDADRWIVSQFAFNASANGNPAAPFVQCIAVSANGNPTGHYFRYAFDLSDAGFNDYPKLGITSESITYMANVFIPGLWWYSGPLIGAMDKYTMYAGNPAWMLWGQLSSFEGGMLPVDVDRPGSGTFVPALFASPMTLSGGFDIWEITADWSTGTGTYQQVASIPIPGFDADLCGADREACIPQPSPGPALEAMSDRLMHRLAVRDFGTYRSMVAVHTIDVGGGRAGIRWYEFRESTGSWSLYQSGTYAPNDGLHRWMPSIAMNAAGDIGVGYLVASGSQFMSVGVAGQSAAASGSGQFDADEVLCVTGSGVQTGTARAGDYSATVVDPVSDTFWHTNEYARLSGNFEWDTRVCEFVVNGSGEPPPPPEPATTMHVSALSYGPFSAGRGQKGGEATVTIVDANGSPVVGANVMGTFGGDFDESVSGVTVAGGTVTLQTEATGKFKGDPAVTFCVYDVTDGSLTYDPADNAQSDYACGGEPPPPPPPPPAGDTIVIASVTTSQQGVGQGQKVGTASVLITDNNGNPAVGYTVTGSFTGDITESGVSAPTGTDGVASFVTSGTATGKVSVEFCVTDVTGGPLDWDGVGVCSNGVAGKGGIAATGDAPASFALGQNYPNPFNPTTVIGFELAEASPVSLRVYDVVGREVATLMQGYGEAGRHRVAFDASHLPAGIYLYVLDAAGKRETRRMTLLK